MNPVLGLWSVISVTVGYRDQRSNNLTNILCSYQHNYGMQGVIGHVIVIGRVISEIVLQIHYTVVIIEIKILLEIKNKIIINLTNNSTDYSFKTPKYQTQREDNNKKPISKQGQARDMHKKVAGLKNKSYNRYNNIYIKSRFIVFFLFFRKYL